MTIKEAQKIIRSLGGNNNLTDDEEFEYTEALSFLIQIVSDK